MDREVWEIIPPRVGPLGTVPGTDFFGGGNVAGGTNFTPNAAVAQSTRFHMVEQITLTGNGSLISIRCQQVLM